MTGQDYELKKQRKLTWSYLMRTGEWVVIERPVFEETSSGGRKEISVLNLPVQRMALTRGTPGGPEYGGESVRTDVGPVTRSRDRIMARHDADLQKLDRVVLQGKGYEVQEVDRSSLRVAAKVTTRKS